MNNMTNKLKLQWVKWRFDSCIKTRSKLLDKAKKHLLDNDESEFNKYMDKASEYAKRIVKLTKEAEELISMEQLKTWFWN